VVIYGLGRLRALCGVAALCFAATGCATVLGIGDPTLESDGGDGGEADGGYSSQDGTVNDATMSPPSDARPQDSQSVMEDGGDDASACPPGEVQCGGGDTGTLAFCAQVQTDLANCGTCAAACPVENNKPTCVGGMCTVGTCTTGFLDCDQEVADGCESNPQTDRNNCGGCGMPCASGELCVSGVCALSCQVGQTVCEADGGAEYCANTSNDALNCGGCGNACPVNHDSPTCIEGQCHLGGCATGYSDCNTSANDGCESNTQTDVNNCGTCGNVCSATNATVGCTGGVCTITGCATGYANCDGAYSNGCEVNTQTDHANCGTCSNECGAANASAACSSGTCAITSCNTGFANCNGLYSDGCEVNTQTDHANCGVCSNPCATTALCSAGSCVLSCGTGQTLCTAGSTAYCANTTTDPSNCGACGTVCASSHNTPTCNGSCQIGTCLAGYLNCNGVVADGCEVNSQNDPNNCGSCGGVCGAPNAVTACSSGSCAISSCAAGYADCNGSYATGCAATLGTDPNNCGGCGNVCANDCVAEVSATTCSGGNCTVQTCDAGYYDVDGLCSDGCECAASAVASCASPTVLSLSGLGTSAVATGNLIPTGTSDWYQATFSGNTSASYHPLVTLSTNTNSEYMFDVLSACPTSSGTSSVSLACGVETGNSSTGVTTWEVMYASGVYFSSPYFIPITPVGTILIHVYRAPGAAVDCTPYTLTVSN
jgi:hypothetical protein